MALFFLTKPLQRAATQRAPTIAILLRNIAEQAYEVYCDLRTVSRLLGRSLIQQPIQFNLGDVDRKFMLVYACI